MKRTFKQVRAEFISGVLVSKRSKYRIPHHTSGIRSNLNVALTDGLIEKILLMPKREKTLSYAEAYLKMLDEECFEGKIYGDVVAWADCHGVGIEIPGLDFEPQASA